VEAILKNTYYFLPFILVVLLSSVLYYGCSKNSSNDPIIPISETVTTTISGAIFDEFNTPLASVEVKSAGQTVMSNSNGAFTFHNIQVPKTRFVVNAFKAGYFRGSVSDVPKSGGTSNIRIYMVSGVTQSISATAGGVVEIESGTGVEIPPAGVVDKNGTNYNGNVNVSLAYLDPTAENFSEIIPGGDLSAVRTDNSAATLVSYGIIKVEMKSDAGENLQIKSGKTSTITVEIPSSMISSAPETIPLWYYDDTIGMWKEEGTATKQGDKYIGSVGHFSDWNCDVPEGTATIKGLVIDCNDNPVHGISVKIGQASASTGPDGRFERRVPANTPFVVQVLGTKNFGLGSLSVSVPPLAEGTVYDVGSLEVDCPVYVKGIIKCGNDVKYGQVVVTWDGGYNSQYTGFDGSFIIASDVSKAAKISIYTFDGKYKVLDVVTPSVRGETLDLGIIEVCDQVQIGINKFTLNGGGYNNKTFVFASNNEQVYGYYNIEDTLTLIIMSEIFSQDTVLLFIFFNGDNLGTATDAVLYLSINSNTYIAHQDVETTSANVFVTKYSGIGGLIEGTFNGSLINVLTVSGNVTISEGQFSVIRMILEKRIEKMHKNKIPAELWKYIKN
jgi:hypothetical protein